MKMPTKNCSSWRERGLGYLYTTSCVILWNAQEIKGNRLSRKGKQWLSRVPGAGWVLHISHLFLSWSSEAFWFCGNKPPGTEMWALAVSSQLKLIERVKDKSRKNNSATACITFLITRGSPFYFGGKPFSFLFLVKQFTYIHELSPCSDLKLL